MPFRHLSPKEFGIDQLKDMQAAYDAVCERLKLDASDPARGKLAVIIIDLVAAGSRENLLERALERLSERPTRRNGFLKLGKAKSPPKRGRHADPSKDLPT